MAQSIAYTQQRGLEGLEFWKDAWLQPHFKERSAPHALSVDTRTTDMEKIKELASCWHCSFTQLPCVALKSDGCITCRII